MALSFSDALADSTGKRRGQPCTMSVVLASLDTDDQAELRAALISNEVEGSAIARALQTMGIKVAANAVTRHRRGDCRCD